MKGVSYELQEGKNMHEMVDWGRERMDRVEIRTVREKEDTGNGGQG